MVWHVVCLNARGRERSRVERVDRGRLGKDEKFDICDSLAV